MSPPKGTQSGRTTNDEQPRNHPFRSDAANERQALSQKEAGEMLNLERSANQTALPSGYKERGAAQD